MRIRVVTHHPLKPLKAWFGIPNDLTIANLKERLHGELPPLTSQNIASQVTLQLDGYDLLDSSTCGLVLAEGDIVE